MFNLYRVYLRGKDYGTIYALSENSACDKLASQIACSASRYSGIRSEITAKKI